MSNQFVLVGYRPNEEELLTNAELCRKCKGSKCCQHSGCTFSPEDFPSLRLQYLRHFIKRGYTTIACYPFKDDNDEIITAMFEDTSKVLTLENLKKGKLALFLKIRNAGRPIVDLPNNFGILKTSGCVLLGEEGCKLPFRKRPKSGRMVLAKPGKCIELYPLEQAVYDWLPYQELLWKLMQEFS